MSRSIQQWCGPHVVCLLVCIGVLSWGGVQHPAYPQPRGSKPTPEASSTTIPKPLYAHSWAVIIGINTYHHYSPLTYAEKDALDVANALQRMGFPRDHILRPAKTPATKEEIEDLLYGRLRQAVGPEDRVVIFFAGHGVSRKLPRGGEEGFLLPANADPERLERTAIAMADMERIGDRLAAKHILFVLDACHSGFAIKRSPPSEQLLLMADNRVVQIMAAGLSGETAVEKRGNGIFTAKFLEGLEGAADKNRDGVISFYELFGFVYNRVVDESRGQQHPVPSTFAGEGEFLFLRPGVPMPVVPPAGTAGLPQTPKPSRGPGFPGEAPVAPSARVSQPPSPQRDALPGAAEKLSISPGDVRSGALAKDTMQEYTFVGSANTPLLFIVEPSREGYHGTGGMGYQVTIFRAGLTARRPQRTCCANAMKIDFTPPAHGEYTVQLKGTSKYGNYKLLMQRLE